MTSQHDIFFFLFNVREAIFTKSNIPMRCTQEANTRIIGKFLLIQSTVMGSRVNTGNAKLGAMASVYNPAFQELRQDDCFQLNVNVGYTSSSKPDLPVE